MANVWSDRDPGTLHSFVPGAACNPRSIHCSYWARQNRSDETWPRLAGEHRTDVLIIGAGITGLSTALELLARGHRVIVCEANRIGGGTTGASTGHLDADPEIGPRELVRTLGADKARTCTRMRLDAIRTIAGRCDPSCDFTRLPAYYYTEHEDRLDDLCKEFEAASEIGLQVAWSEHVPVPRAVAGYRMEGMARIDPFAYVRLLARRVVALGGVVFEESVMPGVGENHPESLESDHGRVFFNHVIAAAHSNYTNSQRVYVQCVPRQSYAIAARVAAPLQDALFWDDSEPYYYMRRAGDDGHLIIAGGCDHRTGWDDECQALDHLEQWVRQRFSVEEVPARSSAELFEPTDGLPFIGKVAGKDNVWVATGLSGTGLTLGTAAGQMLADLLDGRPHPLEKELSPGRMKMSSAVSVLARQQPVFGNLAERVLPAAEINVDQLAPGQGAVGKVNGKHVAVCRDRNGNLHYHRPVCIHMGGVVHWNECEQTWDCPVHGGRYAADGQRIYGPPARSLDPPEP